MVRRDVRCRRRPAGRARSGRWVAALLLGGAWWWAVLRALAQPERTGPVEALVVAGGWGLSLLPVHCVPWRRTAGRGVARFVGAVVRRRRRV
ncbi:hypothetical protein [Streptomyces sp. ISL-11]|uniref:hypothetical protein n=1 Tax=Streptomyces sp. ISL-11 TaxID=2819174 RepID=UPI002035C3B2|nr:hypothetical protein [Streptomyces sp. ISL-11]